MGKCHSRILNYIRNSIEKINHDKKESVMLEARLRSFSEMQNKGSQK